MGINAADIIIRHRMGNRVCFQACVLGRLKALALFTFQPCVRFFVVDEHFFVWIPFQRVTQAHRDVAQVAR